MRKRWWWMALLWVVTLAVAAAWSADERRNPFGVVDVENPSGDDIKLFAATVHLPGGAQDKNAAQWVPQETAGTAGTLDGAWWGRWASGTGIAQVKEGQGRVYILYTEHEGRFKGAQWLVEAIKEGPTRLVGRWGRVGNPQESGPYVGLIVQDDRIDGTWGGSERWDFRRKLRP